MTGSRASGRLLYGERGPDGRTPYWRTTSIWAAAEGRPVVSRSLDELGILDDVVWFGGPHDVQPTIRRVAERARDIFAADLTFPVVVTRAGEVLDGAHRIARAYLDGLERLPVIILDAWPLPDGFVDDDQT